MYEYVPCNGTYARCGYNKMFLGQFLFVFLWRFFVLFSKKPYPIISEWEDLKDMSNDANGLYNFQAVRVILSSSFFQSSYLMSYAFDIVSAN